MRGNWDGDMSGAHVEIRSFTPADQDAVKALVLAGLADHWGTIIPGLNPDLNDIARSFAGEIFLLAEMEGQLVGCGALVRRDKITGEIVRMSVAASERRKGIGKRLVEALCRQAALAGMRRLVLETTADWHEVRLFYERLGFVYTHFVDDEFGGQAHYERRL